VNQIACPFCGQDWLRHYQIKGGSTPFWLCQECESLWPEGRAFDEVATDLSGYLPQFSRADVWDAIEQV